jgi:hypothetical protein
MKTDGLPQRRRQAGNPFPQIGVLTHSVPHIDLASYGARSGAGT